MSLLIYSIVRVNNVMHTMHGPPPLAADGGDYGHVLPGVGGTFDISSRLHPFKRGIDSSRSQRGLVTYWSSTGWVVYGMHVMSSTQPENIIRRYRTLATEPTDAQFGQSTSWLVVSLDVEDCFSPTSAPVNVYRSSRRQHSGSLAIANCDVVEHTATLDGALAYIDANPPAAWPYAMPRW